MQVRYHLILTMYMFSIISKVVTCCIFYDSLVCYLKTIKTYFIVKFSELLYQNLHVLIVIYLIFRFYECKNNQSMTHFYSGII